MKCYRLAPNHLPILRKLSQTDRMATQTLTLTLPFLRLNAAKAEAFSRLVAANVAVANAILAMPRAEPDLATCCWLVRSDGELHAPFSTR